MPRWGSCADARPFPIVQASAVVVARPENRHLVDRVPTSVSLKTAQTPVSVLHTQGTANASREAANAISAALIEEDVMITMCRRVGGSTDSTQRRRRALMWVPMALSLLAATAMPAHAQTVFDDFNIYAVTNGPTAPTTFTLAGTTKISQIITYHWNNGLGAQPGTISLVTPAGVRFGPYLASGVPG